MSTTSAPRRFLRVRSFERPPILKDYLERYRTAVQRYFDVPAGSPVEAFEPIVGGFPVFELTEAGDSKESPTR